MTQSKRTRTPYLWKWGFQLDPSPMFLQCRLLHFWPFRTKRRTFEALRPLWLKEVCSSQTSFVVLMTWSEQLFSFPYGSILTHKEARSDPWTSFHSARPLPLLHLSYSSVKPHHFFKIVHFSLFAQKRRQFRQIWQKAPSAPFRQNGLADPLQTGSSKQTPSLSLSSQRQTS